jgi:hypothetical protein
LRIRITTSGKQGRLTVPFETSVAKLTRKASAEARSSSLTAEDVDGATVGAATGLDAGIGFGAGVGLAAGALLAWGGVLLVCGGAPVFTAAAVLAGMLGCGAAGLGAAGLGVAPGFAAMSARAVGAVFACTASFTLPGGADATFAIVVSLQ